MTAFKSPKRARVVVASLADEGSIAADLVDRVESRVEELGIPREDRRFRPHVTVARIKRPGNASDFIDVAALEPAAFVLDELRLYRSRLLPTGSEYTVLASEKLGR